jgi:hypothetical protein
MKRFRLRDWELMVRGIRPRHAPRLDRRRRAFSRAAFTAVALFLQRAPAAPIKSATPQPEARIIQFSGTDWWIKDSQDQPVGPGPVRFSGDNVFVQDGKLHLRISRRQDEWYAAEVVSLKSFGYGTYVFTVSAGVAELDPRAVLGMFTWSDNPEFSNRELDIEVSRWGSSDNANTQCVVQPWDRPPGSIKRFQTPNDLDRVEYRFTWQPGKMTCHVSARSDTVAESFNFSHQFTAGVPVPGDEKVRINLWLFEGHPPAGDAPVEVIVDQFRFVPLVTGAQ